MEKKSNWHNELASLLRDELPYCFPDNTGNRTKMDEREFFGTDQNVDLGTDRFTPGTAGVFDHIVSLINKERKKMFMSGYLLGARDLFYDTCGGKDLEFQPELNQHTAEKRFNQEDT